MRKYKSQSAVKPECEYAHTLLSKNGIFSAFLEFARGRRELTGQLLYLLLTWISTLSQDFNACQPAQLERSYLDETAVCPKITHAAAPPGFLLAHPKLLSSKRQRACDLSALPVVFVLCMVPYLDLFSPFRYQQVIN